MNTAAIVSTLLAVGLAAAPLAVADPGGVPNENGMYGICNAWSHNGNGQENGNPENAPPFQSLQDQAEEANQTVEEFCLQFPHPGQGGGNGNGNNGGGNGNGGSGGDGGEQPASVPTLPF